MSDGRRRALWKGAPEHVAKEEAAIFDGLASQAWIQHVGVQNVTRRADGVAANENVGHLATA
jgi:hypothetical protein